MDYPITLKNNYNNIKFKYKYLFTIQLKRINLAEKRWKIYLAP